MSKPVIRQRTPLLAGLLVLACALPLSAAQSSLPEAAAPWLKKLVSADSTLNYEGELVYLQDGQMSSVSVVHHSGPDGVQERLTSLSGTPREVVRGLKRLSCKLSPGQAVELPLQPSSDAATLASQLEQLNDYYIISLGDHQRIAARDTQRINLMPRGSARYGHRLWLDVETGLPLKTQMVDGDGNIIEQAMFTQIAFLEAPIGIAAVIEPGTEPDLESRPTASVITSPEAPPSEAPLDASDTPFEPGDWHATQLPTGFRLTTHRRITNSSSPTEQLVYSDGMASISVFIEQLTDGDNGFNGSSQRGTITVYGRTIDRHQLTIIGEVPQHTARQVGDGIQQQSSQSMIEAND